MNAQIPTPEAFLGAPYDPAEDEAASTSVTFNGVFVPEDSPGNLNIGTGMIWQVPKDPMERVAAALEKIAGGNDRAPQQLGSRLGEMVTPPISDGETPMRVTESSQYRALAEQFDDKVDELGTAYEVINRIEEALGKSTAKPALAAKAVIDEWRNPTVPEPEGAQQGGQITDDPGPVPMNGPLSIEGHTRAETGEDTPDICQECSYAAQDYVVWPCDTVGSMPPAPVVAGQATVQPAHDAPVEAWREYARALGHTDVDTANRSVIRTKLGIAHEIPAES